MKLILKLIVILSLVKPVLAETKGSMGLNGTGVTTWGAKANNRLQTVQSSYPRQDADYQKAFEFTKMDSAGKDLPASAANWSCVRDNITGLIWEGKTRDNGLHDTLHTYTWYNSDDETNGGRDGMSGEPDDAICNGVAGGCDTEKFVKAVNSAGWCGFKDWRMPSIEELGSIVDYGRSMPAIDPVFFPNMPQPAGFWTATSFAPEPSFAWIVVFDEGGITHCVKSWAYHIRLVRGGK
ncbi:hypothetical protein OR1_03559 [Geobacter sp. OR-1]|uniref:Lcl C-terminal domain-containing protein n=1 Tax=Geobacter sp. OR-1 TaxID=1266765 RepID=UPI000542F923|nr:DUF1566 domain-containing protein [Geobacter sp. OR-1]GAM11248.1 hypothetical protein OR1_03559 [Geobacter sp. OR-1]